MAASEPERSPGLPQSPPPWLAAIGLMVLLAVLLGGGLLLTRRPVQAPVALTSVPLAATERAPVSPTPLSTATAAATAALPVAARVTPQPTPTSAPLQATATPARARATVTPAVLQTLQAVSTQTIAMINGTPAIIPTYGPTLTPQPGATEWWNQEGPVDADLAAQIEQAYNHFWEVRSEALYTLDTDALPDVMQGVSLQAQLDTIQKLRGQNQAEAVVVEHNARVMHASDDEAAVEDHYINHSVAVDMRTKQPVEQPPTESFVYDYQLRKVQNVWKVVDAVRVRSE